MTTVQDYINGIVLDVDAAIKVITPRGNGKTLRTNKPAHGIYAYVWRMARFHSGQDLTMPITATWGIKAQILKDCEVELKHSEADAHSKDLDVLVDACLDRLGMSKYTAALRYKGLLY